ncbi:hypothetical protein ACVK1X_001960 [Pseudomonas sp. PvR086]
MGAFGHFAALLGFSSTGYSPDVAANAAIGCGNPARLSATAPPSRLQAFFTPAIQCYGGCAWETFGSAGSLAPGLPPCVQLPPIRVVTNAAAPRVKEQHNEQNRFARSFRTENHRPHAVHLLLGSATVPRQVGVPILDALTQTSDLLSLAKSFAEDAAYAKDTDRHAWAAHYLTAMSKAVIDDVVKVLTPRPARTATESEE